MTKHATPLRGRRFRPAILLASALMTLALAGATPAHEDGEGFWWQKPHAHGRAPFQFALIGDTKYNDEGAAQFGPMQDEINKQSQLRWVMHAGDILGSTLCSDELHELRLADFQAFRMPFVYTPGDNEWADCHLAFLGSFNPLERLTALRRIFFPHPGFTIGGRAMRVTTQATNPLYAKFVENVRWVEGGVVFATIHNAGSNNDLRPWTGIGNTAVTPEQQAEYDERIAANIAWINQTFAFAKRIHAPGVFILTQADPRFELAIDDPARAAHSPWMAALQKQTLEFRRPVVLAHGDTHLPRVDKPLLSPTLPVVPAAPNPARVENFTRVETYGFPDTHWIRVTVNPGDDEVFKFELMTVEKNRRQFAPLP